MKRFNTIVLLLLSTAAVLQAANSLKPVSTRTAPAEGSAAESLWRNRNTSEAKREVARRFLEMLVLKPEGLKQSRLANRPEMVEIGNLYREGKYEEGMNRYFELFYDKLRHPEAHGICQADIDPASKGVANIGDWPVVLVPTEKSKHEPWVNQAAEVKRAYEAIIRAADQLMQGTTPKGQLGEPGSVNWSLGASEPKPGGGPSLPDPGLCCGHTFFPLIEAFIITRRQAYLNRWVDYMEDWSLNMPISPNEDPCNVSDLLSTWASQTLMPVTRLIAGAVSASAGQELIPNRVVARILTKIINDLVLHYVVYNRSDTHNWTPGAGLFASALFYDEFKAAPLMFREARRRNIEDNAVTQNLRDGTENQEDPWYNGNYLTNVAAFPLMAARSSIPREKELPFVQELRDDPNWQAEIQDHLDEHLTYRIHLRVGSDEWPIPFRGGDKRSAPFFEDEYANPPEKLFPKAMSDPVNRAILAATKALPHTSRGIGPSYTSDWFPYAGFNTTRDGWERASGYGALFCAPHAAAYGAYRGLKNNNTFGLNAYGMDLLIDDCTGHYMAVGSPLRVDKMEQFFNAGVYKVQAPAGHKVYQVSAWTEPGPFRWHSSAAFNLMEGVYSGAYADENSKKVDALFPAGKPHKGMVPRGAGITDVTHQRLVQEVRGEKLWIITDRLRTPSAHAYQLDWVLPATPGDQPGFEPRQVTVNARQRSVVTHAETTELSLRSPAKDGSKVKRVPMANFSMHQFTTAELSYSTKVVPRKTANNWHLMYGMMHVTMDWGGRGDQQVISLVFPRPPGDVPKNDLRSVKQITGGRNSVGFEAVTPDGAVIRYLSSPSATDTISLGAVAIRGGSLLATDRGGLALDCTAMAIGGKRVTPPGPDFEYTLTPGNVTFTPIFRPIDPVIIGPDRNVFQDSIPVTMTSRTPGVEIHYTLDGLTPTPQSPLYSKPVLLTNSAVVRACAYRAGVKKNPETQTGTEATAISLGVFTKETPQPAITGGTAMGLLARYWQDDWKKLWFYLDDLKPQAVAVADALFDLKVVPGDNPPVGKAPAPRSKTYAVDYTGFLNVPADGVYTFHAPREIGYPDTTSGYDLRVYVGNNIDPITGADQGPLEWYPSTRLHAFNNWGVALKKGAHPFRVVFLDYRRDAAIRLNLPGINDYVWSGATPDLRISGPGFEKQPIPAAWLRH